MGNNKVFLPKSAVPEKLPIASSMTFGELYVNYASGTNEAFLATKKYDGTIAKFYEGGESNVKSDCDQINSSESSFIEHKTHYTLWENDIKDINGFFTKPKIYMQYGNLVAVEFSPNPQFIHWLSNSLSQDDITYWSSSIISKITRLNFKNLTVIDEELGLGPEQWLYSGNTKNVIYYGNYDILADIFDLEPGRVGNFDSSKNWCIGIFLNQSRYVICFEHPIYEPLEPQISASGYAPYSVSKLPDAFLDYGQMEEILQSKITTNNKLSADLIKSGTTNVPYTISEKEKLASTISSASVISELNTYKWFSNIQIGTTVKSSAATKNDTLTIKSTSPYVGLNGSGQQLNVLFYESELHVVSIQYGELVALQLSHELIPGKQYLIIDYQAYISSQIQDIAAQDNHFGVIVTADSDSSFHSVAKAVDLYGAYPGCDLSKWIIWYDINNDTSLYSWAKNDGHGVIYRMIDEYGNDLPYDFKNILFHRNIDLGAVDAYYYAFSYVDSKGEIVEATTAAELDVTCKPRNNIIKPSIYVTDKCYQILNNNVFILHDIYGNGGPFACLNNTFGYKCMDNTIILQYGEFCENTFDDGCCDNVFEGTARYNSFGNLCSENRLTSDFSWNSFLGNCQNIVFCGNTTNCKHFVIEKNNQNIVIDESYDGNDLQFITIRSSFNTSNTYTPVPSLVRGNAQRQIVSKNGLYLEDTPSMPIPTTGDTGKILMVNSSGEYSLTSIINSENTLY